MVLPERAAGDSGEGGMDTCDRTAVTVAAVTVAVTVVVTVVVIVVVMVVLRMLHPVTWAMVDLAAVMVLIAPVTILALLYPMADRILIIIQPILVLPAPSEPTITTASSLFLGSGLRLEKLWRKTPTIPRATINKIPAPGPNVLTVAMTL